jgi:hypothetical protein
MAKKQKTNAESHAGPSSKVPQNATSINQGASIDDIFAKPSKTKPPIASSSTSNTNPKSSKETAIHQGVDTEPIQPKPSKKKRLKVSEEGDGTIGSEAKLKKIKKAKKEESGQSVPVKEVETVLDPSTIPVTKPKEKSTKTTSSSGMKRDKASEEDEMFRDSRGTGPSTFLLTCAY